MGTKRFLTVVLVSLVGVYLSGCSTKFWDPTQIGRFRPVPKVNVILDSLGVAEETSVAWEGAEEPRPSDVVESKIDYVFGSGDIVRITIFELLQEGLLFVNDFIITETGRISIPDIGVVQAEGLTENQLEDEIRRILMPTLLKEPSVTVALLNSQRRTFSILGSGVPAPSRYVVPRYDFRLADALATAGGISQINVSYVYVSRKITGEERGEEVAPEVSEPEQPGQLIKPEQELLEVISPRAQLRDENKLVITTAEMATEKELMGLALPEGFGSLGANEKVGTVPEDESGMSIESASRESIEEPIEQEDSRIEWIFQDGKWVPIQVGKVEPSQDKGEAKKAPGPLLKRLPESFEWDEMATPSEQTRVIEIPSDRLLAGDPRYNIVIKPGDTIHVPVDVIGHFYIGGHTNYQGAINLTGRPMTLKMAIAAAGGLGPLAWPKYCEVVRRISRNKEEIVMVDLDKIATGQQPDFFIKPNDLINVGTHATSRWRAVLRNAFRATYGFGFIYDRNFGFREFGIHAPLGPFGSEWDPFD
ncbi:polysaccharide biosynthesis/export family protein [Planctomycetota bacterium]